MWQCFFVVYKAGGIVLFLKRPKRHDLDRITRNFQKQTEGLTNQWALDCMGAESFLTLLTLADYAKVGKTRAILISFKLGYLAGKEGALERIKGYLER